jgi:hypothetical protein
MPALCTLNDRGTFGERALNDWRSVRSMKRAAAPNRNVWDETVMRALAADSTMDGSILRDPAARLPERAFAEQVRRAAARRRKSINDFNRAG